MTRYDVRIEVVVSYEAETRDEARKIAEGLADTVVIKPPSGRGAEFVRSHVSRLIKHGG